MIVDVWPPGLGDTTSLLPPDRDSVLQQPWEAEVVPSEHCSRWGGGLYFSAHLIINTVAVTTYFLREATRAAHGPPWQYAQRCQVRQEKPAVSGPSPLCEPWGGLCPQTSPFAMTTAVPQPLTRQCPQRWSRPWDAAFVWLFREQDLVCPLEPKYRCVGSEARAN